MTEKIVNVTAPKLSGADRRIALHAIAASAKGNPVEVALQILAGIATLDGDFESSFVLLWPREIYDYPRVDKRAECGRVALEAGDVHLRLLLKPSRRVNQSVHPDKAGVQEGVARILRDLGHRCARPQILNKVFSGAVPRSSYKTQHIRGIQPEHLQLWAKDVNQLILRQLASGCEFPVMRRRQINA